jgi:uncharacterized protein (TIGR02117 family)
LPVLKWGAIGLASAVLLFALAGWAGSSIPRNGGWEEAQVGDGVEILIGSNGVHTEIVMPLATTQHDWRAVFPASDLDAPNRPYTHVAVSWGERAFFLETPRWRDMDPLTALRALAGAEGILHVAHYVRPAPSADYRTLRLNADEYARLTRAIAQQLAPEPEVLGGYGANDVFYTTGGTYHLGNTCNQWTSDRLAEAGVETGAWTPFPGGVMKWVPPVQDAR